MKAKLARTAFEYGVITVATLLLVVGVYFFKFPNNFSFGGVTGIAVVLSAMSKASDKFLHIYYQYGAFWCWAFYS